MKYEIRTIYFKNGKPTDVNGKIIAVEKIFGSQDPVINADYEAICLVEVGNKHKE